MASATEEKQLLAAVPAGKIRFILDAPADSDFFNSHEPLALAVATAIRDQPGLKVIGLVGHWGSGKSTVVSFLRKALEGDKGSIRYLCFPYDAWLHQGDSQRRSFLESLISFLRANGFDENPIWQQTLDQLAGRIQKSETKTTTRLSSSGKIIGPSLLLLPLGISLVGFTTLNAAFGDHRLPVALWALRIGLFLIVLPALLAGAIKLRRWWMNRGVAKEDREDQDPVLSLLMNKADEVSVREVELSPEPTTIEFQRGFRKIMNSIHKPHQRLVFIIDNLDRLPPEQAIEMWATIRSFFLGPDHITPLKSEPTVVLPVDPDAIGRMYRGLKDDEVTDLVRAFKDKNFDIVFPVSRPVLSGWKEYFNKQIRWSLGDDLDEEISYNIDRLYEDYVRGGPVVVTPRDVNSTVNAIAALWLRWRGQGVPLASVAYYAMHANKIDEGIHGTMPEPRGGIISMDPGWLASMAAIHFGVRPEIAIQIYMGPSLKEAILKGEKEKFLQDALVPGFESALHRIIDELPQDKTNTRPEPGFICNLAILLSEIPDGSPVWVAAAWRRMLDGMTKAGAWSVLDGQMAKGVALILKHTEPAKRERTITEIAARLGSTSEELLVPPEAVESLVATVEVLSRYAKNDGTSAPKVVIPGSATTFFNVAVDCTNPDLRSLLQPKASPPELMDTLKQGLANPVTSHLTEPRLEVLLSRPGEFPWAELIEAAGTAVEQSAGGYASVGSALIVLGKFLTGKPSSRTRIQQLIDSGHLVATLNGAYGASTESAEYAASALLLLMEADAPGPNGLTWAQVQDQRPEIAVEVDSYMRKFGATDNTQSLSGLALRAGNINGLIKLIISRRVREKRLGKLDTKQVIAKLSDYLNVVSPDLHDEFIRQLSLYANFWEELAAAPFEGNVLLILRALARSEGGPQAQAAEFLVKALEGVAGPAWEAAIRGAGEPYKLAAEYGHDRTPALVVGSPLQGALTSLIKEVLETNDQELRNRWLDAAGFLSPPARQAVFNRLRDQIDNGMTVVDLIPLLSMGSGILLNEAGFAEKPDDSVNYVILPILGRSDGLAWLQSNPLAFTTWVEGASPTRRDLLKERLLELWQTSSPEARRSVEALQAAWGFEVSSEPSKEESAGGEGGVSA